METDPDKPSPGWPAAEQDADVTLWLPGGEGRPEVPMFFRRVPPMDVWSGEGESPLFRIGERGSGYPNEEPVHLVRLERPFYLATFPVTQAQWRGIAERAGLDADPSVFKGAFRPVESVSWGDVATWCAWGAENPSVIRARDAQGGDLSVERLRLPFEAEWEIACRSGTSTEYGAGDGAPAVDAVGWFGGNSGSNTHRVGEKQVNPWGFHDLHGNVWEWCEDVWDARAYSKREEGWLARAWTEEDAGTDREDWGDGAGRVMRGGSWCFSPLWCRSAYRFRGGPSYRIRDLGFRPVLLLSALPGLEGPGPGAAVPTEPG